VLNTPDSASPADPSDRRRAHSWLGMTSCIIAFCPVATLLIAFRIQAQAKPTNDFLHLQSLGNMATSFLCGCLSLPSSGVGIGLAIAGLIAQRYRSRLLCWIGLFLNCALPLGVVYYLKN
jgi:hypothetical protein